MLFPQHPIGLCSYMIADVFDVFVFPFRSYFFFLNKKHGDTDLWETRLVGIAFSLTFLQLSSLVGTGAYMKKTIEPISEGKHESFANAFVTEGGKTFLALNNLGTWLTFTNLLKNISISDCTLFILNCHNYHTLYPRVNFDVIFNIILLHVTSTCFLFRWNKVKKLKHPSSKSITTKSKFFHISLCLVYVCAILFSKFSFKIFKFPSLFPWQNSFTVLHPPSLNHCFFCFHH